VPQRAGRPHIAFVVNNLTPYRVQSHTRVKLEIPEYDVRTYIHWDTGQNLWIYKDMPDIGVETFPGAAGEKDVGSLRYYRRDWNTGGEIIKRLKANMPAALVVCGYAYPSTFRVIRWAAGRVPMMIWGDSNVHSDNARGLRRFVKNRVVAWVLKKSNAVLICGSNGQRYFARYGCPAEKMFAFPVEPDYSLIAACPEASMSEARECWKLAPQRRRLLICARLVPVKGIDVGIDAFVAIADRRPDWDLIIAGGGPLRSLLEARVPARLRDRVTFTGFLDKQEMVSALYRQCDVLLHPAHWEPWGVVLLEAAAAGLAIVTTPVVGASANLVVDHESGRLVRAGDREALTEALMEVTDAANIDRLREGSRRVSNEFRREFDPVIGLRKALTAMGVGRAPMRAAQA
jgi:glycosyltransferase involved in cell wall biosynthesis